MNNGFLNNFVNKLRSAWNIFRDTDPTSEAKTNHGAAYSFPQHRPRLQYGNEKSIVGAIYNRFAVDVASMEYRHVRVDENDSYVETVLSGLNRCLSLEANIDQTAGAFLQDAIMSMFDEGAVAIVPIDTNVSIMDLNSFDILSMRTAKILQWYPNYVRVRVYNDIRGEKEEITISKSKVAIIENPFYSIMNEKASIGQRLISKLNLLDVVDEASSSGKLDIVMQMPYSVKTETKRAQAEERIKSLQDQLKNSTYGIGYVDATEKITQLNRPAENNLLAQVEFLTRMLYGQLGISEKILDGTADEKELLNYYNRIVDPLASAITVELKRKFLTKTAQTQGQSIKHFRNLFSIVTPERLAEIADKFLRNEIASPNDLRAVIGWKPSKAPGADELRNRNISQSTEQPVDVTQEFNKVKQSKGENQNGR